MDYSTEDLTSYYPGYDDYIEPGENEVTEEEYNNYMADIIYEENRIMEEMI